MKTQFKFLLLFFFLIILSSCKNNDKPDSLDFQLIDNGSYRIDTYNGTDYYILSEAKKPMDGYYVVGNKDTKWEEFNVEKGILNGDYIVFHTNGEIYSHAIYANGKRHGKEKTFHLSGKLKQVSTYSNDKIQSTVGYYESGQTQSETTYENENRIEAVSYDILGNITFQMLVKDGRAITQTIKSGKVFMENISSNYDNFKAVKFYNDDGSLRRFLRMLQESGSAYIIELDENENEIKRIDAKANPEKIQEYLQDLRQL